MGTKVFISMPESIKLVIKIKCNTRILLVFCRRKTFGLRWTVEMRLDSILKLKVVDL